MRVTVPYRQIKVVHQRYARTKCRGRLPRRITSCVKLMHAASTYWISNWRTEEHQEPNEAQGNCVSPCPPPKVYRAVRRETSIQVKLSVMSRAV